MTSRSRLGLTHAALEVEPGFDFWHYVVDTLTQGGRIDYLICDEAQFYSRAQIDQLAKIVDELQLDVFAFGILTDFRTAMFEGSIRLVELADRVHTLQVEALCWCGKRATHNARTESGVMVTEGERSSWSATSTVSMIGGQTRPTPRSPTKCSVASTTAADSPRPAPRQSAWLPSPSPSADGLSWG